MHIEPGVVDGAKIFLSVATARVACILTAKATRDTVKAHGLRTTLFRTLITTLVVFCSFEVLWHHPVGVSEVHLILGSTLFLLFGLAPTAIGLAIGLLIQGVFFAPTDLPQLGMNVTTLLVPLFALAAISRHIVKPSTPYADLSYRQTLKLSLIFQGGVVAWVTFWTLYGQGVNATTLSGLATFATAYIAVILFEPLLDLGILAAIKGLRLQDSLALERNAT